MAGSSCGSQTSCVSAAGSCGSKGKAQSPANSCFNLSALGTAKGSAVIVLIVGIAPQILPGKFPQMKVIGVSTGGRRPPIGRRRHLVVSANVVMDLLHRDANADAQTQRNAASQ